VIWSAACDNDVDLTERDVEISWVQTTTYSSLRSGWAAVTIPPTERGYSASSMIIITITIIITIPPWSQ